MKTFLNWINEQTDDSEYEIQSGDTLSAIAKSRGTTVQDLMKLNPAIKDPNKISAGQRLTVSKPVAPQPTPTPAPTPAPQPQQPKPSVAKPTGSDWRQLIGGAEGLRTQAYWDPNGRVWTIGKGSTTHPDGRPVKRGDVISKDQANQYMEHYVNTRVIPTYKKKIPGWDTMNSNQQNSLISFGYNVGENFYGAEGFETVSKALSSPETWGDVPAAMALYNKGRDPKDETKKVVLPGLITRRKREGEVWSSPVSTN